MKVYDTKMDQHISSNCGTVTHYSLLRTQKASSIGHGVEEIHFHIMIIDSACIKWTMIQRSLRNTNTIKQINASNVSHSQEVSKVDRPFILSDMN
jgi:hypothetical protein